MVGTFGEFSMKCSLAVDQCTFVTVLLCVNYCDNGTIVNS